MGDLDALAIGGEQHGMVAHDVPGTHSREADGLARPRTGLTFATIDGNLLQIAPERPATTSPCAAPDGASTLCR